MSNVILQNNRLYFGLGKTDLNCIKDGDQRCEGSSIKLYKPGFFTDFDKGIKIKVNDQSYLVEAQSLAEFVIRTSEAKLDSTTVGDEALKLQHLYQRHMKENYNTQHVQNIISACEHLSKQQTREGQLPEFGTLIPHLQDRFMDDLFERHRSASSAHHDMAVPMRFSPETGEERSAAFSLQPPGYKERNPEALPPYTVVEETPREATRREFDEILSN